VTYKVHQVTKVQEALEQARFLLYGLNELRHETKARETIDNDRFIVRLLHILHERTGVLLLVRDSANRNVGFLVADNATEFFREPCAIVLWVYTKDGQNAALKELFDAFLKWCREHRVSNVRAYTRRINGSAMKFYEERLGFTREYVLFKRDLLNTDS